MTSVAERTATASTLPQRAASLAPLLDQHAQAGDDTGVLTEEVVEALHREGLFGVWVPRPLGGFELDPVSSVEVIENLAYGDPSTAWVLMATALATGSGGAFLDDDAVEQLFAGDRFPVIAGQGTRPGTAVPQDGGFALSGAWAFASGIKHSSYIHTLAAIEGTGELRIFVLPVEQATLIENWDVLGLRATGSIDYTIDSVFVPEAFTHPARTETPKRGGRLYTIGIVGLAVIGHSGWALGVGRRMLDELIALAQSKSGRPGAIADTDSFQEQLANAELSFRAARALVYETWNDVKETVDRGDSLSVRQHTLLRGALTHATWTVNDVCLFVYKAAGTSALRAGTLQRFLRDLHAGTQHMTSGPPVIQACGRELAGLAEGQTWAFIELVDGA